MDVIAASMMLLLIISLSCVGTRAEKQIIKAGSPLSLNPSTDPNCWVSPSGLFAFGFYQQGNSNNSFAIGIWLVGEKSNTVVWTANRDDPPITITSNAKLQLTKDGKLVLQTEQGQERLIANANETASYASMLDSGNLVLYNQHSTVIWQSFDHPTDTLLGDQILQTGGQLVSASSVTNRSIGRFRLKMQEDGNLVLYPLNTDDVPVDAYWASDTSIYRGFKLHLYLNETGILVLRNGSDSNLNVVRVFYDSSSANNENRTIYRATLDYDGVFRLYVHVNNDTGNKLKSWPLKNACAVRGLCGFNSFCTFNDDQPYCTCLPGFGFIDPNQSTLGCKRNFSEDKDNATSYNMVSMNNIKWAGRPYFEAIMSDQQDCSFSCFTDSNCWAALYEYEQRLGKCKKQQPPLQYAVRVLGNEASSFVAFLKVGNSTLKSRELNPKPVPAQPPVPPPIKSTSNKAIVHIILVTSAFTLLLSLTVAVSSHFIYKIRVLRYKRLMETGELGLNEEVALRRFSYNELRRATNDFKQELGKGSFGAVYKGALYKGTRLIAVKRLEKLVEEGEKEFQAEMRAIGKTHHRNLVRLLGYCVEGSKRLLVYEYMSNGSLAKILFGDVRRPELDERVRIAVDIARGILYLHEECEAPVIHCDIKPQNILMDEFWTAKISDFGLAKLLMPDQTRTFTGVRGTRGYLAPEWNKNTPISVKADVYSYGIVLLEIVCCRRNMEVDVLEPEEILLSRWAYKCFTARQLNKLVFWEAADKNVLENMVKVALWCIQDEPVLRPTMKSVVLMLEGITDAATPPCPTSDSM